jgi:hypothetical protein
MRKEQRYDWVSALSAVYINQEYDKRGNRTH